MLNGRACLWLIIAMGALATAPAQADSIRTDIEFRAHGEGLSGEFGALVPLVRLDDLLTYGHFRAGLLPSGGGYGSLGAGVRQRLDADWVLGAHLHYDFTVTPRENSYQQVSVGLEALGTALELRANAYLPIGETRHRADELSLFTLETGRLGIRQGYEAALAAFDVEAGVPLPLFEDSDIDFKLFAGAYAEVARDIETVYGVSGRAELAVANLDQSAPGARLTLGARASYDNRAGAQGAVYGRLSVPIGGTARERQALDPLYARVERDAVVRTRTGAFGHVQNALTADGRTVGAVGTVTAQTGDAAAINRALGLAGENALILASGDIAVDDALVLALGQTWLGGTGVIELTAQETGTVLAYANTGARARVAASDATHDVFALADHSSVLSTDITGGNTAILADGVRNVRVADVAISGAAGHGIFLRDVSGARIADAAVTGLVQCEGCGYSYSAPDRAHHAGLYALGVSDLEVAGLSVDQSTYGVFVSSRVDGTSLAARAQSIVLNDVSIRNTREEALMIVMAEDVAISDLLIDNTAMARTKDSVVFFNTVGASLDRATIRGGINGLMFANTAMAGTSRTGDITVSDVLIQDTSLGGIFINPADNLVLRNVALERTGDRGIFLLGGVGGWGGPVTDIRFEGLTMTDPGATGLYSYGDITNIDGDLAIDGAGRDCQILHGPWMGSLTQDAGHVLSINGRPVDPADIGTTC